MIKSLLGVFEILPRIEQPNMEDSKILHIARYKGQAMPNCSRYDLRIGCGKETANAIPATHESPPSDCGRHVERQDAPVELPGKILFDPSLKLFSTGLFPYLPRASDEFSYGLCRKEKVPRAPRLDPFEHGLVRSWPDRLADHIGVQQKGRQVSSADWPVEWSRSIVRSASVRGEARRKAINSAPVFARGRVSFCCSDRRMSWASSPPERRAPAIALTRDTSCREL